MKEVRICSCGRLHFLDGEIIESALKEDKDVLFICGKCGRATMIGADRTRDWWNETDDEVFNMYSYDKGDTDFVLDDSQFENTDTTKGIYKVIYSVGKGVPMMSGSYARNYSFGYFLDIWFPDFYHIKHRDITVEEIMTFITDWEQKRKTVNMRQLLRTLTGEEAELLSHYYIEGLDWTGTQYERKGINCP